LSDRFSLAADSQEAETRYFRGTREEIAASGLAAGCPFPGDPGARKTVTELVDGERHISIRRLSAKRFEVVVSPGEGRRRRFVLERDIAREKQRPSSAEAFRAQRLDAFGRGLARAAAEMTVDRGDAYRFVDEDVEQAALECFAAVYARMRTLEIVEIPSRSRRLAALLQLQTARLDASFAAMLATLERGATK
jgi:hypothetical protein